MTPIATLVSTRLDELDLSYREAAAKSDGYISHGHLNQIALGRTTGKLSSKALKGLCLALDLPLSKVEDAAARSLPTKESGPQPFELPPKAHKLTLRQRKAVLAFIDVLLEN